MIDNPVICLQPALQEIAKEFEEDDDAGDGSQSYDDGDDDGDGYADGDDDADWNWGP